MANPWANIFRTVNAREANKLYGIAFTPRSGSTYLGDVLSKSGCLGNPKEWFNPPLRQRMILESGCRDLKQYYRHVKSVHRTRKVFGVELTWHHLKLAMDFSGEDLFTDIQSWFFLRRRDYVAQGVSLHKAVESGVFHSTQAARGVRPKKQARYNGLQIAKHILRTMQQESALKHYFSKRGIQPIPLWYEEVVAIDPAELVNTFLSSLDLPLDSAHHLGPNELESGHTKLADRSNNDMIAQFREDHTEFLQYWDENRGNKFARAFVKEYPQYQL